MESDWDGQQTRMLLRRAILCATMLATTPLRPALNAPIKNIRQIGGCQTPKANSRTNRQVIIAAMMAPTKPGDARRVSVTSLSYLHSLALSTIDYSERPPWCPRGSRIAPSGAVAVSSPAVHTHLLTELERRESTCHFAVRAESVDLTERRGRA
jgi:hypothetical protein